LIQKKQDEEIEMKLDTIEEHFNKGARKWEEKWRKQKEKWEKRWKRIGPKMNH
jgi:penicillin-binding protein 2A